MNTNHNFSKNFECIYYPAIVKNEEKAIHTLGGRMHLSEMISSFNGHMDLKFRPDDPFCKPTVGERVNVTGLLLKLRIVKKRKKKSGETVSVVPQVLGSVTSWFQFKNMCDYQYLPVKLKPSSDNPDTTAANNTVHGGDNSTVHSTDNTVHSSVKSTVHTSDISTVHTINTTVEDLLPKLRFSSFPTLADLTRDDVDYFLPPAYFSKVDAPQTVLRLLHDPSVKAAASVSSSSVASELNSTSTAACSTSAQPATSTSTPSSVSSDTIGVLRKTRQIFFTNVVSFDKETIPQPQDEQDTLDKLLGRQLIHQRHIDAVRQVFEERPVVSKTVLRAKSGVNGKIVKLILPLVAYYFYTGPFRVMWVRLGYDPRKDPNSCRYQVLDFRLKNVIGSVAQKMSVSRRSSLLKIAIRNPPNLEPTDSVLTDKYYVYRPGYIPPYRQMFYQLCDIDVPEVTDLLATAPLRPVCHERFGWYPDNLLDRVRAILGKDFLSHMDDLEDTRTDIHEANDNDDDDNMLLFSMTSFKHQQSAQHTGNF
uniref:General transcription factor 3C polypeptide 5 n=1 Tax=Cacopsylla melanoneura TaxID=428564 RepID=A0A8D9AJL1_9HEMI